MTTTATLSALPRYTISVILSYLQPPDPSSLSNNFSDTQKYSHRNHRDGVALLLASRRFAYFIAPLFRVPKRLCRIYKYPANDGKCENRSVVIVEKYRFLVLPIQDPITLLDRLNTRRLRQRILWVRKMQRDYHYSDKSIQDADYQRRQKSCQSSPKCYQRGRTVEELALEEWLLMGIHCGDASFEGGEISTTSNTLDFRVWPVHLELLRFADSASFPRLEMDGMICSCDCNQKWDKRRTESKQAGIFHSLTLRNILNGSIKSFRNYDHFSGCKGVVLLASYPRSGNTLLRTLIERTTSIITGSDTRPDRTLSRKLAHEHDLVGEGLVGKPSDSNRISNLSSPLNVFNTYDPSVNVVKTHFPERKGWKPVNASSVLLLVRNPYDAIDSYWNLCCTNTHTRSVDESVYEKYAEKFEGLARHEIRIWCEFHYYWIDVCQREGLPLLIVRYEDLVLETAREMQRVMRFLIDGDESGVIANNEMTMLHESDDTAENCDSKANNYAFWEWRIRHATGKTTKPAESHRADGSNILNLGSYRPRSDGGLSSIGKTLRKRRYSESVLLHMHDVAVSMALERKQAQRDFFHAPTLLKKTQNDREYSKATLLQMFGYDIYSQQFPDNILKPVEYSLDDISKFSGRKQEQKGVFRINATPEIRKDDDPYGREMTNWRRGETANDTNPFPTINR
ncbi:hypothetical protein ACHAXS_007786 [Conticribra weissflogii]